MPKHEGAVHLVCPGKYGCLLGEVDDEGLCRSTMPIVMSAKGVHATEQLLGEGAVHLVCPGMSFLAACPGEEDDEVSISTLWTRKGNFIEWIKSGSSVSVALRRQHRRAGPPQVHADLALGKGPRAASAYAKSLPQVLCPSEDFKCISSQRYSGSELA